MRLIVPRGRALSSLIGQIFDPLKMFLANKTKAIRGQSWRAFPRTIHSNTRYELPVPLSGVDRENGALMNAGFRYCFQVRTSGKEDSCSGSG